ncbi:MAG: hypothetical protein IH977_09835 [Nitrospinae bacterium]|nr:hypothetical protein [Nitrospinota bacterium]
MRVYLDNNLFSYLLALAIGKQLDQFIDREARSTRELLARPELEVLCSDESLAEMECIKDPAKRQRLQSLYATVKSGNAALRNAAVRWDDRVTRWDSPDANWDHPHTDADRKRIESFLKRKGIPVNEFDVRYLANAALDENKIDIFLTADKKTIWNFRHEFLKDFGIRVALPSELLAEIESQNN